MIATIRTGNREHRYKDAHTHKFLLEVVNGYMLVYQAASIKALDKELIYMYTNWDSIHIEKGD